MNHYFSDDPTSYKISMWLVCCLGIVVNSIGFYLELVKYPRHMAPFFRLLSITFLGFSASFQYFFTGATTFVVMLPYIAFFPVGFLKYLGISTMFQFILVMSLWAGCGGSMVAPFVYRMQLLLSPFHVLNSLVFNIFCYGTLCVLIALVAPPIWYFCLSYSAQSQMQLKNAIVKEFTLISRKIYDNDTIILDFDLSRPSVIVAGLSLFLGFIFVLVSIPGCCIACYYGLKKVRGNMSPTTRAMHKAYITSLISQMTVSVILFAIPMVVCILLLCYNSYRCGIPQECNLPKVDPWDREIMKYTDVYWERKENVCERPEEYARLEGGKLKSRDGFFCRGRCIYYVDDDVENYGTWQNEENSFNCDVVQTECRHKRRLFSQTHVSLLTQIVEKKGPAAKKKLPNIFVITVDSIGFSQARRNLPKTLYFLDRQLGAVEFFYLNKVGHNSYPNAVPLWFGKSVEDLDKTMFGLGVEKEEWSSACKNRSLYKNIMEDFRDYGYRTYHSEYWRETTLHATVVLKTYKGCEESMKQYADHEAPPLQIASIWNKLTPMSSCQKFRKLLSNELTYFSQFMRAYKENPKFGWLWLTFGAHDYEQESVMIDTEIYDFLIRNKDELGESFVFFFGDHGLRFGEKMETKQGIIDDNNPFLVVSVPMEHREKPIVEVMKRNSKKLQTHYDTRATWLDIVKNQPDADYSDTAAIKMKGEKGNSYFREQNGSRNCYNLPIPFQCCLCDYKMGQVDKTSPTNEVLANFIMDYIHTKIIASNNTAICGMWKFKSIDVKVFVPIDRTGLFEVILTARQYGYEKAKFKAMVRVKSHNYTESNLEMVYINRVDRYHKDGDCAPEIMSFCHCVQPFSVFWSILVE